MLFLYQLLEERQLIWDQREVQLERQLDTYEKQQNEVLSTAQKVLSALSLGRHDKKMFLLYSSKLFPEVKFNLH